MENNKVVELNEEEVEKAAGGYGQYYTAKSGDSYWSIAQRFGIDLNYLLALNQVSNPNVLKIGQIVKLY